MESNIIHHGQVLRVDGDKVYVELRLESKEQCGGCALSANCGTGASAKTEVLTVEARVAEGIAFPAVGTEVAVAAPAQAVSGAASMLFVLPLIAFVAVIVGAMLVGLSEALATLAGTVGAALALALAHFRAKRTAVWTIIALT